MPTVSCVCGEKVTAPPDMGVIRQRDYVLDWFTTHLANAVAKRKAERLAARIQK